MFQDSKSKKNQAAENIDNAMSDFKSGKNELKNAKDNAVSGVKSALREAADDDKVRDLRETAREAGERVQHFLHDRREDVVHARETAERQIRSNPLAAAGILLAAGAILGRLMKR